MAKPKSSFRCSSCQHTVAKWVGRCPECGTWGPWTRPRSWQR
ncbi:hypothetical protein GS934_12935 [Rhodococcus hoagii]|nr:hypothetical protein [Prescottella equi]NKZ87873.1 hypothetical protein [Prescottella equi]